jgi:hypothetical protein
LIPKNPIIVPKIDPGEVRDDVGIHSIIHFECADGLLIHRPLAVETPPEAS